MKQRGCAGMVSWVNWSVINEKYPSKLDKEKLTEAEYRKQRTIELYDYLPQTTLEDRRTYVDIRDAIIEMNYTFFGYIASNKFVNNNFISYEDKFQSALFHFCEMWEKYRFITPKYRTDVAFGVFFKPRITECMERELDEVKYSLRRTLCMEVGNQLGKHWAKVTYEDLSNPNVKLSPDKLASLEAMFGSMYVANLDTHAMFIESEERFTDSSEELYTDNYNSLTDLLVHELVEKERDLTEKDIESLSDMMCIPFERLINLLPCAKQKLHDMLIDRINIQEVFN